MEEHRPVPAARQAKPDGSGHATPSARAITVQLRTACVLCGEIRQSICPELRKRREAVNMSIRELGRKLGWSHASLSFIESGARPPSPTDVARYLGGCGPGPAPANRA
ncbi:helix-turn-helix domain-containing protein [Amycolatopsis minnesotensis]|uniref:helix-turn-helix domain-containing protein n=1 Tax=Amycolatopsis minnesotensis TaxID=337894 RepID=UPI003CD0A7F3